MSESKPFEYKELPIESVEADEEAEVRIRYDVSDLTESIHEVGQLSPGFAYKSGDKYKVFVGIRRLRAVKELYEKEGKPDVFKAFVFEEKPSNYYDLIREENMKRSDLTGLDKVYIIMTNAFANKILSARDARLITSIKVAMRDVSLDELYELALVEQRAKEKGYNNHLSLPELLFLFRDFHSLEERKLFAIFFLVHRRPLKHVLNYGVRTYALSKVELLTNEDLQIAGLSKEDVDKIIAIYQAPPYQSDIIQGEFEEKEPEGARENPESEERSLEIEKSEECNLEESEIKREPESTRETNKNKIIVNMDFDVEYEVINGHRIMLVKEESGIEPYHVKDGQELEIDGVKLEVKYGGDAG